MKFNLFILSLILLMFGCQQEPVTGSGNELPRITSIEAAWDSVEVTKEIAVTCVAEDPDGDSLEYRWTSITGTFSGEGNSVVWQSPNFAGIHEIGCEVFDGAGGSVSERLDILVFNRDSLQFKVLERSAHECLTISTEGRGAIKTEEEWQRFWQQNSWCRDPQGNLAGIPQVDFAVSDVIFTHYGLVTIGCRNYVETIELVYETNDSVYVRLIEFSPLMVGNCSSITYPIQMATIAKTTKPIRFIQAMY